MNTLLDIGHPAHVYYFRNFYKSMVEKGHSNLIMSKNKEISHELLESYSIPYVSRDKDSNSILGKVFYLSRTVWKIYRRLLWFKPGLFLTFSASYIAQASLLFGKPHIVLDDAEHARMALLLFLPFSEVVLSQDSYRGSIGDKQVKLNGLFEFFYMHPNHYSPDPETLNLLGVNPDEKYVILRFVSWLTNHNFAHRGNIPGNKRKVVEKLSEKARVFISSEKELPEELELYRIDIPYYKKNHALYYASQFYGESITMASESVVQGMPVVFPDKTRCGTRICLKTGMRWSIIIRILCPPRSLSIERGLELLGKPDNIWRQKRENFFRKKPDVTYNLVSFVENYPNSTEGASGTVNGN